MSGAAVAATLHECARAPRAHCNRSKCHRFYLLDLARALPPESPWDTPHLPKHQGSVFFRMLRPELLRELKSAGLRPVRMGIRASYTRTRRGLLAAVKVLIRSYSQMRALSEC